MTRAVVAGLDARAGLFPIRLTEGDALPFTIEFLEADGATPTPLAAGTYVLEVRRAAGAPVTHTVALTRGGTGNHELTGTFTAELTAQIGTSRSAVHAIVNTTTSSTLLAGPLEIVPRGEAGAGWPDNLAFEKHWNEGRSTTAGPFYYKCDPLVLLRLDHPTMFHFPLLHHGSTPTLMPPALYL